MLLLAITAASLAPLSNAQEVAGPLIGSGGIGNNQTYLKCDGLIGELANSSSLAFAVTFDITASPVPAIVYGNLRVADSQVLMARLQCTRVQQTAPIAANDVVWSCSQTEPNANFAFAVEIKSPGFTGLTSGVIRESGDIVGKLGTCR